jgi:hypothetical protein
MPFLDGRKWKLKNLTLSFTETSENIFLNKSFFIKTSIECSCVTASTTIHFLYSVSIERKKIKTLYDLSIDQAFYFAASPYKTFRTQNPRN